MGVILKGGFVVTENNTKKLDIKVVDDKIVEIGENLGDSRDEIVEVGGCIIVPGGIDTHTHFDMDCGSIKTSDDFRTGSRAAIIGGTTTVLDFAEAGDGENLIDAFDSYSKKALHKSICDFGFHMTITSIDENTLVEMEELVKKGITSFKLYMAYKGSLQVDDGIIYKVLDKARELGVRIAVHCENGDLLDVLIKEELSKNNTLPKYHPVTRGNLLEKEAISRLIDITKLTNSKSYVVHLSTKEGLSEVKKAIDNNIDVIAETCPQYLLLDDSLYNLEDFESAKYVMSPPLRKRDDIIELWKGINEGYIKTVGTDHCSFNFKGQKDLGISDFSKIPNGSPGVENRLELLYTYGVTTGKITLNKFVEITSTNAAKIFGMYPNKGVIAVGSDADIVVINPNKKKIISSKTHMQDVDYNPYEGFEVNCIIDHVFLRGEHIVKNSKLTNEFPNGKYIHRQTI